MKIGINAAFLNEKPTGMGVFTKKVSTRISALNKDTIVFTSIPLNSSSEVQTKKTPECIRGSTNFQNNFNRLIHANTLMPLMIKKYGLDILYCPMMEFPLICPAPLVVTVLDLHPVYFPKQFGLAATYFKFSLKLLPRLARRIIVTSNFVKKELIKNTGISNDCIDVVPLAYDHTVFKPQDDKLRADFLESYGISKPYILFIGSLFPYKNINTLLKAFLNIKNSIPHSLVIIGKKELSSGHPAEDNRILYLDYVRSEDISKFYSYADLLVHPSLTEGFGMTVLEAMACGTPVISSNGGSLPETVGDAALLFNPTDSRLLEEMILKVINNEKLRNDLIENGAKHVKKFSWDRTAKHILESFEKAVKR